MKDHVVCSLAQSRCIHHTSTHHPASFLITEGNNENRYSITVVASFPRKHIFFQRGWYSSVEMNSYFQWSSINHLTRGNFDAPMHHFAAIGFFASLALALHRQREVGHGAWTHPAGVPMAGGGTQLSSSTRGFAQQSANSLESRDYCRWLRGGFKHFLFSTLRGEISQFD